VIINLEKRYSLSLDIKPMSKTMPCGNPTALLWINSCAAKIWKEDYGDAKGKYKAAHKKAVADYHKEFPHKAPLLRKAKKGHKKPGPKKGPKKHK